MGKLSGWEMNIQFKKEPIPFSAVDLSDDTYRITTNSDVGLLMKSISTVGLIHPPILMDRNGTFSIISGFRRMAAVQRLSWETVEARIIERHTDERSIVLIAISENACQRPFNLIEQSRSIHLLERISGNGKALNDIANELGFPDNSDIIHKLKCLSLLPLPVQQGILSETISFAMALELAKLDPSESTLLANVFEHLNLSLNKQREILSLAEDICQRDEMSLEQLFSSTDIQFILYRSEWDKTQKARKLRAYLRQKRYPSISHAEKQFEKKLYALKLKSGIQLSPPKYFEGMTYSLTLQFKNMEELRLRKESLEALMKNPSLKELLE